MGNAEIVYKLIEGIPIAETFEELKTIYQTIFEDADCSFFKHRFKENPDVVSILAYSGKELIGFKIGYPYSDTTFYSWVGGILKTFRNKGVASQLAKLQEAWVKEHNYNKIRTKSMNRFKPMMILNLKNGFEIVQVYKNEKGQTKVIFEKDIS